MKFSWIFDEFWNFICTLWHCRFDRTLSYSAKVCARLKFQNLSKFCSDLRKIGICFGNRPIADFFHDQTIFLKDYELYIIGHSLPGQETVSALRQLKNDILPFFKFLQKKVSWLDKKASVHRARLKSSLNLHKCGSCVLHYSVLYLPLLYCSKLEASAGKKPPVAAY